MEKEYYYNETVTRFYDVVYDSLKHLEKGRDFYLNEIKNSGGASFEAGVGTGRIFIPALKSGADVYGIDYSENMLNVLKNKLPENERSRLYNGDIRNFNIDKKFKLIISPFRVFQHLLTIEDQLNTLNCLYEHLEPGGKLIFDVFNPDFKRMINPISDFLEFDGDYEPGLNMKRYSTVNYKYSEQILDLTFRFEWDENGSVHKDSFSTPLRYYFHFEIENLIGRTPFKLEKIYGGFDKQEFNDKSNEQIVVCRK